jgi:hypothetical protein
MVVAACALIALVIPARSAAQVQARYVYGVAERDVEMRADALHERAAALFTRPDRYTEAAVLLARAAHLRSPADPTAVSEFVVAAKLYAYADQVGIARTTMEIAAERALAHGEVARAAHVYLDAAFLAIRLKQWQRVRDLSARAERLAASPHLEAADRTGILMRINPARLAIVNR